VVQNILNLDKSGRSDEATMLVKQIYDLTMLPHKVFDKEHMEAFLERSNKILEKLGGMG
jgi:molecular chaperone HtpG